MAFSPVTAPGTTSFSSVDSDGNWSFSTTETGPFNLAFYTTDNSDCSQPILPVPVPSWYTNQPLTGTDGSAITAPSGATSVAAGTKGVIACLGRATLPTEACETRTRPVPVKPPAATARIAGSDRFATAAAIAGRYVQTEGGFAGSVAVANGVDAKQGFDALSANFLAGEAHAPILLTSATSLPAPTADALKALFSGVTGGTIYVMGGPDSVSATVEGQMKAIAELASGHPVTMVRVAGNNRYATSAAAATTSGDAAAFRLTADGPMLKTAFLASGQVNADALAAGSASFGLHIPVLLTEPDRLPVPVAQAIKTLGISQVIILGGTDRVSDAVVDSLEALGVSVTKRVAGSDRFATAADIYTLARASLGQHGAGVYLANGLTGFPDALSVGPLAGVTGSPILTVPQNSLPTRTKEFLADNRTDLTSVTALGGPGATITQAVLDAAARALH